MLLTETLELWKKPQRVFGSTTSTTPVSGRDIEEILHSFEDENEVCAVFRLKDGRYAAVHKEESDLVIDGTPIVNGSFHVADTYDDIIMLGLTKNLRLEFGLDS